MRLYLFFILFFLFSCSSNVKQVYICGDHPCADKKEMNDYFDNNISVEVYTIDPNEEKKKLNLVKLNLDQTISEEEKKDKDLLINKKFESKKWVKKHHSIASVSKHLYKYYKEKLWIK